MSIIKIEIEGLEGYRVFFIRVVSGAVLIILMIAAFFFNIQISLAFMTIIAVRGLYEFYRIEGIQATLLGIIGYITTIGYYFNIVYNGNSIGIHILLLSFLIGAVIYIVQYHMAEEVETDRSGKLRHMIFGILYITVTFGTMLQISMLPDGKSLIWIVFISAWGSDSLAYVVGRLFGKKKLSKILSPKKTIAGSIGGVVGAVVLALVFMYVYEGVKYYSISIYTVNIYILVSIIVFFASIMGQIGDLFASSFKRAKGVKEYGNLIPGHGGVLDRYDSILFVSPTVYIILSLYLNFMG